MDLAGRKWAAFLLSGYLTDPRTHKKLMEMWGGAEVAVVYRDRGDLSVALSKYLGPRSHW